MQTKSSEKSIVRSTLNMNIYIYVYLKIHLLQLAGQVMRTISTGDFTSICMHAGSLYGAMCDVSLETSYIHMYHLGTWRCIRELNLPCTGAHFHTIKVTGSGIIVACWNEHCIYVISHDGQESYKYDAY